MNFRAGIISQLLHHFLIGQVNAFQPFLGLGLKLRIVREPVGMPDLNQIAIGMSRFLETYFRFQIKKSETFPQILIHSQLLAVATPNSNHNQPP